MGYMHVFDWSAEADSDLSAKQYYIVKVSAANKVDVCNSAALAIGVLQNAPGDTHAAEVLSIGRSKVVSDGSGTAIAAGDKVMSDGNGKAVKATGQSVSIGTAMGASSADGTVIEILMTGIGPLA
jgi:hypothetical protein